MKAKPIRTSVSRCWSCLSPTSKVFEFSDFPFTGRFPKSGEESLIGDLTFSVCKKCTLIQLEQAYSPEDLYSEYFYRSSINNTMRLHLSNLVIDVINQYGAKPPGNWLDIGCNDGYTISLAKAAGWNVFGVDPSNMICQYYKNLFKEDKDFDKRFINDIFPTDKLNKNIKYDVITCISMFYDIFNLKEFINSIEEKLKDDGVWIVEMNYTKDMMINNGYDMISHEHITYYTLKTFIYLLQKNSQKLKVFKCSQSCINGGSLRIFIDKGIRQIENIVEETIAEENKIGLHSFEYIENYFNTIKTHALKVNKYISELKSEGKTVSIYGASTRGNTNLLLSNLEKDKIDFAYEKNTDKIGRYCPGSDILIKTESDLLLDQPDYLIIMPYSFINEFIEKEKEYLARGGKMVTLVPEIKVHTLNN